MRNIDLTGQRFGRLVVLERMPQKGHDTKWKCRCDCGKTVYANTTSLRSGHTKSCGCYTHDLARERHTKHGLTANGIPRIYRTWDGMKQRCNNPRSISYPHYGGRGIKVCREWAESFQAFYNWAMTHGYADDLQIDRINNDGDYCPENCRWVTPRQNIRNRRTTVRILFQGKNLTIPEWSLETGLSETTIRERHRAGKTPEEILKK